MFSKSFSDAATRMMKVGFIFLLKAKRKSDAEEADSVLNKYNKEN